MQAIIKFKEFKFFLMEFISKCNEYACNRNFRKEYHGCLKTGRFSHAMEDDQITAEKGANLWES